jgi:hypothetical protein
MYQFKINKNSLASSHAGEYDADNEWFCITNVIGERGPAQQNGRCNAKTKEYSRIFHRIVSFNTPLSDKWRI